MIDLSLMLANSRASLLGLPPELRLETYDCVCQVDLDCNILEKLVHRRVATLTMLPYSNSRNNVGSAVAQPNPYLPFHSDRATLTHGIRTFMDRAGHRAYVLQLPIPHKKILDSKWQNVLCRPSDANALILDLHVRGNTVLSSDSIVYDIVGELYQTLNLFLHYGPYLTRGRPLPQRLALANVVLNIDTGTNDASSMSAPPPEGGVLNSGSGDEVRICRNSHFTSSFQDIGVLSALVRRLILNDGVDIDEIDRTVKESCDAVYNLWRGPGVVWSPRSLRNAL